MISPRSPAARHASAPLIEVRDVSKAYRTVDATITAADHLTLDITAGTTTALTGPSGSGKSTLLHLIGGLDRPDTGSITVDGINITTLGRGKSADYRAGIGFVFQRFNLLPALTVEDNVIAPTLGQTSRRGRGDRYTRARELLAAVGLAGRDHTLATRLSGGQQQRVAIARALINDPTLVLADEPTGNLDSTTGADIIELLLGLRETRGTTVVIATHDPAIAARADRILRIRDGALVDDLTLDLTPDPTIAQRLTGYG
jgi:putative ABC transport system ATP-binding protein